VKIAANSGVEEKNAIIKSAMLTTADYGLLTAWLYLDYGGCGQAFGGYCLFLPKDFRHQGGQGNYAGTFIWRVMEIADVEEWSRLPGKTIRVRCEHSSVHAIGHIVKDDWFYPENELEALRPSIHPEPA
jgi:hypothetical protein